MNEPMLAHNIQQPVYGLNNNIEINIENEHNDNRIQLNLIQNACERIRLDTGIDARCNIRNVVKYTFDFSTLVTSAGAAICFINAGQNPDTRSSSAFYGGFYATLAFFSRYVSLKMGD